ncbi:MAM and LDL-receptor class A domain-containing protein 1-like [Amphiura filiformis]|uniref:MAM and LDL-receptor class A domain-containing protein 1-like n=1 Tax=Amphiura filiformis TaxID=82378 RepID=UPI003B224BBF
MCTWTNTQSGDDFDWIRRQGGRTGKGPSNDHTTGTRDGYYMFVDYETNNGHTQLQSNLYPANPGFYKCISFWYYMNGINTGILTVLQLVDGQQNALWQLTGDQSNDWMFGQVPMSADKDFRALFDGEVLSNSATNDVAIDDVTVTDGKCPVTPYGAYIGPTFPPSSPLPTTLPNVVIPPGPGNCDFEDGICQYTLDPSGDMTWIRGKGLTDTDDTGPSKDHTHGTNGWYLYVESNDGNNAEEARIISGLLTPTDDNCLVFWYHMHGDQIGTLNVYIKDQGGSGPVVWTRDSEQGDQWLRGQIGIDFQLATYQIVFETIRGRGYRSDIAIDDILVENQHCHAVTPSPGSYPPFCDLESGFGDCGFDQERDDDDFDWILGAGSTGSNTGPDFDHTYGTQYVKFDFSSKSACK